MWDKKLTPLKNGLEDISDTLARAITLRQFNRSFLGFEDHEGSLINHYIGMGTRKDAETGEVAPVTRFYDSYYERVLESFANYPVTEIFGIGIDVALRMPVNKWSRIETIIRQLGPRKKSNTESELIKLLGSFLEAQGGAQ